MFSMIIELSFPYFFGGLFPVTLCGSAATTLTRFGRSDRNDGSLKVGMGARRLVQHG